MAAPKITILDVSAYKISDEDGFDSCVVTFKADQKLKGYRARADGTNFKSGVLVDRSGELFPSDNLYPSDDLFPSDYTLDAGAEQIFVIYFDELENDGEYRINVYGVNEEGEWTPYAE
ncbi:hypothetical protein [Desertibacillus haloalkaliphilus]|uniref:hypothetical protein n=1 Tax=Desertibacillus haloalkaliphilus TaxID=1328930 RepID=UPI001C26AB06|nr:hypothetical protein [Desertibacillus haloalkaliphilus]MBU8908491.1 hypothetical protein [Desertibacillus haloalkaliphilus]